MTPGFPKEGEEERSRRTLKVAQKKQQLFLVCHSLDLPAVEERLNISGKDQAESNRRV